MRSHAVRTAFSRSPVDDDGPAGLGLRLGRFLLRFCIRRRLRSAIMEDIRGITAAT